MLFRSARQSAAVWTLYRQRIALPELRGAKLGGSAIIRSKFATGVLHIKYFPILTSSVVQIKKRGLYFHAAIRRPQAPLFFIFILVFFAGTAFEQRLPIHSSGECILFPLQFLIKYPLFSIVDWKRTHVPFIGYMSPSSWWR